MALMTCLNARPRLIAPTHWLGGSTVRFIEINLTANCGALQRGGSILPKP